eukprot:9604661-Alexandrium_andersonii.AAC.1
MDVWPAWRAASSPKKRAHVVAPCATCQNSPRWTARANLGLELTWPRGLVRLERRSHSMEGFQKAWRVAAR